MTAAPSVTFLVDVDNTLLDNDRIRERHRGAPRSGVRLRRGRPLLDDPGAPLRRARIPRLPRRRAGVVGGRRARSASARASRATCSTTRSPTGSTPARSTCSRGFASLGPTVVLTDGDAVFQPHKIERAGIARAVDGHVLVYVHKEEELDDVERRYPAERYVLVDDKLRILTRREAVLGRARDDGAPAPGPVRERSGDCGGASGGRRHGRRDRRSARPRPLAAPAGQSSIQRRKPPRNASSLCPRRQFGGSSPRSRAFPPPSTTYSGRSAA